MIVLKMKTMKMMKMTKMKIMKMMKTMKTTKMTKMMMTPQLAVLICGGVVLGVSVAESVVDRLASVLVE